MPGKKRRMLNSHERFVANLPALIDVAEKGNLEAQHDLAAFYATDDLSEYRDEAEAVRWYTKAAESGHAESQYDLGFMLILGEGTQKDIATGLWWIEQALINGWEYAAHVLADIYERGLYEVEPNPEKALYWKGRATNN